MKNFLNPLEQSLNVFPIRHVTEQELDENSANKANMIGKL